jgi:hypothetical protein
LSRAVLDLSSEEEQGGLIAALLLYEPSVHNKSVTPSNPSNTPIIPLYRHCPAPAEPAALVGVAAVGSVVPLTVCRSPCINPNAARSYVHPLSQGRRWRSNGHRTNESKRNERSRKHLLFSVLYRT